MIRIPAHLLVKRVVVLLHLSEERAARLLVRSFFGQ
jgi:hypothetical protein